MQNGFFRIQFFKKAFGFYEVQKTKLCKGFARSKAGAVLDSKTCVLWDGLQVCFFNCMIIQSQGFAFGFWNLKSRFVRFRFSKARSKTNKSNPIYKRAIPKAVFEKQIQQCISSKQEQSSRTSALIKAGFQNLVMHRLSFFTKRLSWGLQAFFSNIQIL